MTSLEILDLPNLTDHDYDALHFAIQDMWATSLWELVRCTHCEHIASKKDIFWHLPKEKYEQTVETILRHGYKTPIACRECGSATEFIYGEKHRRDLKDKIQNSAFARVWVTRDAIGEITGMGFYYIHRFEKIFYAEFQDHYERLGIDRMKEQIESILQKPVDHMIALSTIGFRESHKNLELFFAFFEQAFKDLPEEFTTLPGITEIDSHNRGMSRIFCPPWGTWMDIDTGMIAHTRPEYDSKVVLMEKPVEMFADYAKKGLEGFLSGLIGRKRHP